MRERLKVLDNAAARVAVNPMLPADVRAGVAELAALCRELVARVEAIEAHLTIEADR
jgi:hypothetical protein